MIKPEQTPEFKKALNKALEKLRVRPRYALECTMYKLPLKDITALNDYLSKSSEQELKELSKHKLVLDIVEDFQINLIKDLVLETARRKKYLEQVAKNLRVAKEREVKWAKQQEKRLQKQQAAQKLLQVQISPNFLTQLKLTTEQKAILKKMVDEQ